MITFQNVTKKYSRSQIGLDSINLTINPGEMVFLTGHSGAGKSTLLKLIAHIEQVSSGELIVDNKKLHKLAPRQIPYLRRKMGIVFQDTQLLKEHSVFQNVALPLLITGTHEQTITSRVRASLDKVGLRNKENLYPHMLSGGEQQRVGIARAIVHKPLVLLADEPTGNLDPKLSLDIMHLFEQFNQLGTTVLIATHDTSLIKQLPHRELVLEKGQVIA